MQRTEKEQVVTDLAEQLRSTESLIVADYRGLTNAQLQELRAKLRGSGARLQVVKNTLTRRAAEAAGTESLLALLEGPTAIAFVETDGDPVGRREGARRHRAGHEGALAPRGPARRELHGRGGHRGARQAARRRRSSRASSSA